MVDRIVPATAPEDIAFVERTYGYRDSAVVVGEPFRQWVIEDRFAGRTPPWALAGATFVDDVTPFELIKMRVLNAAQTSFAYLGLIAGHEHTSDDMTDPVLTGIRPPHAGRGEPADPAAGARHRRHRLSRPELWPAPEHGDPPPQPPDRHRRLAEDRPAHPQPDPRAARARAAASSG